MSMMVTILVYSHDNWWNKQLQNRHWAKVKLCSTHGTSFISGRRLLVRWSAVHSGCCRFSTFWAKFNNTALFLCLLWSCGNNFKNTSTILLHRMSSFMQGPSLQWLKYFCKQKYDYLSRTVYYIIIYVISLNYNHVNNFHYCWMA